jgi:hypothetical protein
VAAALAHDGGEQLELLRKIIVRKHRNKELHNKNEVLFPLLMYDGIPRFDSTGILGNLPYNIVQTSTIIGTNLFSLRVFRVVQFAKALQQSFETLKNPLGSVSSAEVSADAVCPHGSLPWDILACCCLIDAQG